MRLVLTVLLGLMALPAAGQEAGDHTGAEQRWAAENAAVAAQWHIVAFGTDRLPCVALSDYVPGATTPEEALAKIRVDDPDAYLNKPLRPGEWERIIRTQGHNLRMVLNESYCRVWASLWSGSGF